MEGRKRTIQQNKALHQYFKMVAETLNDNNLDMRAVLKPEVEIPWSTQAVKDFLWRPVQRLQVRKESTKDLTTREIDKIFDTVNRHLAKHGVSGQFPSIEQLMIQMEENKNTKF